MSQSFAGEDESSRTGNSIMEELDPTWRTIHLGFVVCVALHLRYAALTIYIEIACSSLMISKFRHSEFAERTALAQTSTSVSLCSSSFGVYCRRVIAFESSHCSTCSAVVSPSDAQDSPKVGRTFSKLHFLHHRAAAPVNMGFAGPKNVTCDLTKFLVRS
jgi:hypothetical protein